MRTLQPIGNYKVAIVTTRGERIVFWFETLDEAVKYADNRRTLSTVRTVEDIDYTERTA